MKCESCVALKKAVDRYRKMTSDIAVHLTDVLNTPIPEPVVVCSKCGYKLTLHKGEGTLYAENCPMCRGELLQLERSNVKNSLEKHPVNFRFVCRECGNVLDFLETNVQALHDVPNRIIKIDKCNCVKWGEPIKIPDLYCAKCGTHLACGIILGKFEVQVCPKCFGARSAQDKALEKMTKIYWDAYDKICKAYNIQRPHNRERIEISEAQDNVLNALTNLIPRPTDYMKFQDDLIPKIENGTKTQTRRLIKGSDAKRIHKTRPSASGFHIFWDSNNEGLGNIQHSHKVGTVLSVMETVPFGNLCQFASYHCNIECSDRSGCPFDHLPRWTPLVIRITKVEAQRLCDITLDDIAKEGIQVRDDPRATKATFIESRIFEAWRGTWESIYGPGTWDRDKDRWAWVYTFERV